MQPIDDAPELSHDPDEPSRSQRRREALAVFDLAEELVRLSTAQLAALPMSDELRALVAESQRITAPIARKRQLQYLAKQMRRREDELDPIRAALDHDQAVVRKDTAAQHRVEAWRDRLVAEGDDALTALLAERPAADRQQLRQLIRRAQSERDAGKPPAAARELFRVLRPLFPT